MNNDNSTIQKYREHMGIPPTCGCVDYGVHRALKRLDHELNAGRISARDLGGKHKEDYDQRVATARAALALERIAAAQPGRVNPTPGQLIADVKRHLAEAERLLEYPARYGLIGRIGAAIHAFFSP